jgi:N-acetylglucosaminyl-diphospho-decaprenol L-rhamnosyltransferase
MLQRVTDHAADRTEAAGRPVESTGVTLSVDVVIVSWNVRQELLACIDSVLASRAVDVELIVVDNASHDGSADAVAKRFPKVVLVRNSANLGFARAANQGIMQGKSPWVFLLNPDATVPPDAVAALVARLAELPDHGMIVPRLVDGNGNVQRSVFMSASIGVMLLFTTGAYRFLSRSRKQRLLVPGAWESVEQDVPWAVGAAMLVRRSTIDRIGLMDESFFVYVEDMEWCERMWAAGYRVRFTPAVSVTHLGNRSGSQRFGSERTREHLRNTRRYLRRRHGVLWVGTFVSLTGAMACSRAIITLVTSRARPTRERLEAHAYWRDQARYYVGPIVRRLKRTRPPSRGG